MRFILMSLVLVLISGCGDSSEIKKLVRDRLIDPDSAKFGELLLGNKKSWACIEVNSKNRMGGYSGTAVARLQKYGHGWEVEGIDERFDWCTENHSR
jgi:hypothetical protein